MNGKYEEVLSSVCVLFIIFNLRSIRPSITIQSMITLDVFFLAWCKMCASLVIYVSKILISFRVYIANTEQKIVCPMAWTLNEIKWDGRKWKEIV